MPPHIFTWRRKQIRFPIHCALWNTEFWLRNQIRFPTHCVLWSTGRWTNSLNSVIISEHNIARSPCISRIPWELSEIYPFYLSFCVLCRRFGNWKHSVSESSMMNENEAVDGIRIGKRTGSTKRKHPVLPFHSPYASNIKWSRTGAERLEAVAQFCHDTSLIYQRG